MEDDAFPMGPDERLHTNLSLLFACKFLEQSQVVDMLDFLQWKYLTLQKLFTFSLLCETRRSFTSANTILHLQWNTKFFPTISPQPSKSAFCFPQPWKAIHPHCAAASKDISSFCKFFWGYFKDDCLSLLMIPTLNCLQSPLILFLLHPFWWKELVLSHLPNCLQLSPKNFVSKKSEKW